MAATATAAPGRRGDLRNYVLVTGAYWVETLADGATRMLVLFYFYELGYSAFTIASLFIFYEIFGIITNLVGGWLAARFGLRTTLYAGLGTQVFATAMVGLAPDAWLVVSYVMVSQAFSGIAKDLTKMSSKSAVKLVVPEGDEGSLYRWVAVLTGSKNALKGVGFFLGAAMLTIAGFQTSMLILSGSVLTTLIAVSSLMRGHLGRPDAKAKFKQMFSNDRAINVLAAARIFLFASRDVWFVVGLPVYLETVLGWSFLASGGFLAIWVIGYGIVQAVVPRFVRQRGAAGGGEPEGRTATWLAFVLAFFPAAIAIGLTLGVDPTVTIVVGLIAFGVIFAANSAVHSYLILAYSEHDKATMNVGFYYMANAAGRLAGTVLSGLLYEWGSLEACLWASAAFVLAAALLSMLLPRSSPSPAGPTSGNAKEPVAGAA
ncbi:MAG: organoarsenical effux MFS transporter ArsJ [Actinobacteria bacterium]|nr:organoarsenical effux MFS transporter ArsJ [Actinomycetota bacterium]